MKTIKIYNIQYGDDVDDYSLTLTDDEKVCYDLAKERLVKEETIQYFGDTDNEKVVYDNLRSLLSMRYTDGTYFYVLSFEWEVVNS